MFRNPSREQRQSSQSVEKISDARPSQAPQRTLHVILFHFFLQTFACLLILVKVRQMIMPAVRSMLG